MLFFAFLIFFLSLRCTNNRSATNHKRYGHTKTKKGGVLMGRNDNRRDDRIDNRRDNNNRNDRIDNRRDTDRNNNRDNRVDNSRGDDLRNDR